MKILGVILTVAGAIGVIITGINYANQTESASFLGLNITVSQGNIAPLIITGVILLLGIVFMSLGKKSA